MPKKLPYALLALLLPACSYPDPANPGVQISFFDRFPWASDMLYAALGVGLIALMYWFFTSKHTTGADFVISVDTDDITFTGNFPDSAQSPVADFLRNDCPVEGPYEITGRWDQRVLVIEVRGQNARFLQQRIRNFLKLHLNPPASFDRDQEST